MSKKPSLKTSAEKWNEAAEGLRRLSKVFCDNRMTFAQAARNLRTNMKRSKL